MTIVNLFFCLAFQSLSFLSFRTRKDAILHKALDRGDHHVGGSGAANNNGKRQQ